MPIAFLSLAGRSIYSLAIAETLKNIKIASVIIIKKISISKSTVLHVISKLLPSFLNKAIKNTDNQNRVFSTKEKQSWQQVRNMKIETDYRQK